MANNRMWLECEECGGRVAISKFYPKGGFISGDSPSGWWASNPNLSDRLNEFYAEHAHSHDESAFGGNQYKLDYEVDCESCNPFIGCVEIIEEYSGGRRRKSLLL